MSIFADEDELAQAKELVQSAVTERIRAFTQLEDHLAALRDRDLATLPTLSPSGADIHASLATLLQECLPQYQRHPEVHMIPAPPVGGTKRKICCNNSVEFVSSLPPTRPPAPSSRRSLRGSIPHGKKLSASLPRSGETSPPTRPSHHVCPRTVGRTGRGNRALTHQSSPRLFPRTSESAPMQSPIPCQPSRTPLGSWPASTRFPKTADPQYCSSPSSTKSADPPAPVKPPHTSKRGV